ncbi:MAG: hypothetical protein ACXVHJ_32570 [Solirubrobacteraceae bacterium]
MSSWSVRAGGRSAAKPRPTTVATIESEFVGGECPFCGLPADAG